MAARPLLLLGAGGSAAYAEFPVAQIAAVHPLVLASAAAPNWAQRYLVHHLAVDPADDVALLAAASRYAAEHKLGGVLTFHQDHLATAARVARQLNLPGNSVEASAVCSDRVAVRKVLGHHKIPVARWAEANGPDAATAHADSIGYPVVLKPRVCGPVSTQAASRGDVLDTYTRVLGQRGTASSTRHDSRIVVEESLDGLQIAAETVVLDGEPQIAAITRTTPGPPPAQQAVRHCVYAHDPLMHNRLLRQLLIRTVRALGITLGVLHIEMKLTWRGPRITDVYAHLAGDLVPLLVKQATGVNLPQVAAALATGQFPNLSPTHQRAAGVHFGYSAVSGRIERLAIAQRVQHPLLDRVVLTQRVGGHVTAQSNSTVEDRLAHWVVLGSTAADCEASLDQLAHTMSAAIAPAASVSAHIG